MFFVVCKFFILFVIISFIVLLYLFFFFKQKTAYEMRISDWSSDVCSSDLQTDDRECDRERGAVENAELQIGKAEITLDGIDHQADDEAIEHREPIQQREHHRRVDRKSTRLNSNH